MSAPTTDGVRRTHPLAWAVLATAVLQAAAPALAFNGPGESPGSGAGPELLITPVGWAFSIWGVIYALAIAQAVAVLATGAHDTSPRQQTGQLVLHLGATGWIVMSTLGSSVATAVALLVMLVAAVDLTLTVARRQPRTGWLPLLTRASVGLYAGWVTAACFLNVSTALADTGVTSPATLGWQLVMLVLAALALVAITVASRGMVGYALAGLWALLGIGVTGLDDGNGSVLATAAVAAVILLVVTATTSPAVQWLGIPRRAHPDG